MKRNYVIGLVVLVILASLQFFRHELFSSDKQIVILSTNDIHSQIERFPLLADAVEKCRDTAEVILIDAGDRWTGNAYVDMAEGRRPIIELMNKVEYDVATLGNHEFDAGHQILEGSIELADFPIVCSNIISNTDLLSQPDPYIIIEKDGIKFGFVGVVTNYEGGSKPAGLDINYKGLEFPDPKAMAVKYYNEIADKCDVTVLISHMGESHDREFIAANKGMYDIIAGGHSHSTIDEMVDQTLIIQTGKNLKNIGVTVVEKQDGEIELSHRLISLDNYTPDQEIQAMVDKYHQNPELTKSVGELTTDATKAGLASMVADAIMATTGAEIALYNIGGVRLDELKAGEVPVAAIYSLEPFGTKLYTMSMTPAQIRKMIMSKYNDKINSKEAKRIDLYSTTPYDIIIEDGEAIDVKFKALKENKKYTVTTGDYVFTKYSDFEYSDAKLTENTVQDALIEHLKAYSPLSPNNTPHQHEVVK